MSKSFSNTYTLFAMTLVAALCGVLIVSAYQYTKPFIEKNQKAKTEAAAMAVLPGAVRVELHQVGKSQWYIGFDRQNKPIGVSVQAEGRGFADQIKALYAYNPTVRQIIGLQVIESKETPGIGDKILSDTLFLANFRSLPVNHPIEAVKHGKKTKEYQIDGITGATISSKAIAKLLQNSLATSLPAIDSTWRTLHVAP